MNASNDSNVQSNRKRQATGSLQTSKVVKTDDEQLIQTDITNNQLIIADAIIQNKAASKTKFTKKIVSDNDSFVNDASMSNLSESSSSSSNNSMLESSPIESLKHLKKGMVLKNFHLKLLSIYQSETKNKSKSFHTLLTDGEEYVSTIEYGFSRFANFTIGTNVVLNNHVVNTALIDNYWFKCNSNNIVLDSNNNCKINESTYDIWCVDLLDTTNGFDKLDACKTLVSLSGVIFDITESFINKTPVTTFKLATLDASVYIECTFFDWNQSLKSNHVYVLNYVLVNKLDGTHITKTKFTKANLIKANDVPFKKTMIDITTTTINVFFVE